MRHLVFIAFSHKNSLLMKRLFFAALLLAALPVLAEKIEKLPYGDFEQWAVRYIKESAVVGGKTVTLYAVAPTDTLRVNAPFVYGRNGNIWSPSNAYAKVMGVEKCSGTVYPEFRDQQHGFCCRMDSKLEVVRALGIFDIRILVAGTLFTGRTIEPIRTQKDPYQNIDFGVPFTRFPTALMFDYKAKISSDKTILYAKGFGRPKTIEGHDEGQAYIVLQRRWETSDGQIKAERVATGYERFVADRLTWVSDHKIPLLYGDITGTDLYKKYTAELALGDMRRAMNSHGQIVPVQEVGWAVEGTAPTHMIINMASGCYEAFVGYDGNTLWIDNMRLVYDK